MFLRSTFYITTAAMSISICASELAVAQEKEGAKTIEEVVTIGTRREGRTVEDSPVPIDSFGIEEIERQGNGDLTETLKNIVPSFTAGSFTGDGAAFVRPTSLRGLPPDETLVLINSKRRHRSALIANFGAPMNVGSRAVDIGMIPSIALAGVQVLRDGAAAQYGSDAIAGVMNFQLRDNSEGGQLQVQYGSWFEDSSETDLKVSANMGFPLGESGHLTISGEYTSEDELSRGFQHASAIGVPGARDPAMNWGRPESEGIRTFWNGSVPLANDAELYFFGNYADVEGSYSFFFRPPGRSGALTEIPLDVADYAVDPSTLDATRKFCLCDQLPAGFTPYLDSGQKDFSQWLGLQGEYANGLTYDYSLGYGENRITYLLTGTVNLSWGPDAHANGLRDMDIGDLQQDEIVLGADFSKAISDNLNLAFGFEYREETYTMFRGEPLAADPGRFAVPPGVTPHPGWTLPGLAANGMAGTTADAAGKFSRDSVAAYLDAEWDISDDLLLQAAIRVEDFSDFGSTENFKLAARYNASDALILRGAISTGFRAPTPGQSNATGVQTSFDGITLRQTLEGTISPTSPVALALGGKALEPEESLNLSAGFAWSVSDNLTVNFDAYKIDVDDRLLKSRNLSTGDPVITSAAFFTNALQTETTGFDIVAVYDKNWENGSNTNITLAYNNNKTEVVDQNQINGVNPVPNSQVEDIEENLPQDRVNLTLVQSFDKFTAMVRVNYYGSSLNNENSRITGTKDRLGSEHLIDLELSYNVNENFVVTLGANNIFDEFPDEVSSRLAQGMPYPRRSPVGYHGGLWFLKGVYNY